MDEESFDEEDYDDEFPSRRRTDRQQFRVRR